MDIIEYFDPLNKEHLKAYVHLRLRGFWPEGFIPDDLEPPPIIWAMTIMSKIVDEYLNQNSSES